MIHDMDEGQVDYLRERYDYGTWERGIESETEPLIDQFDLGREELPGWEMIRSDKVPVEGARSAVQSLWRSAEQEGVLLRVDVVETPDATAARELTLRLLGEFQSPEVGRRTEAVIGHVAFELPGRTAILFARSNVVVMVRNAGSEVIAVDDAARRLDEILKSRSSREG